jgi:predicted DNA binding CopG/RHH family protein
MAKEAERLPRPAEELAALADYYDEHDTADEMENGHWVEPMVTTSLRLPRDVFEQLKENARLEGKRHTAYIREILERSLHGVVGPDPDELRQIQRKLDMLLQLVQPEGAPSAAHEKHAVPVRGCDSAHADDADHPRR